MNCQTTHQPQSWFTFPYDILVQVSHILGPYRERDSRSFLTGHLLVASRAGREFAFLTAISPLD
jgi:hypothetical protein